MSVAGRRWALTLLAVLVLLNGVVIAVLLTSSGPSSAGGQQVSAPSEVPAPTPELPVEETVPLVMHLFLTYNHFATFALFFFAFLLVQPARPSSASADASGRPGRRLVRRARSIV